MKYLWVTDVEQKKKVKDLPLGIMGNWPLTQSQSNNHEDAAHTHTHTRVCVCLCVCVCAVVSFTLSPPLFNHVPSLRHSSVPRSLGLDAALYWPKGRSPPELQFISFPVLFATDTFTLMIQCSVSQHFYLLLVPFFIFNYPDFLCWPITEGRRDVHDTTGRRKTSAHWSVTAFFCRHAAMTQLFI